MSNRFFLIAATIMFACQPLAAQQSAWDLLLSENPAAADDRSIGWQDRLILHALTRTRSQPANSTDSAKRDRRPAQTYIQTRGGWGYSIAL